MAEQLISGADREHGDATPDVLALHSHQVLVHEPLVRVGAAADHQQVDVVAVDPSVPGRRIITGCGCFHATVVAELGRAQSSA